MKSQHIKTTVLSIVVPLMVSAILVYLGVAKLFVILPAIAGGYFCSTIAFSHPYDFHKEGREGPHFFSIVIPVTMMCVAALYAWLSLEYKGFVQVTIAHLLGCA